MTDSSADVYEQKIGFIILFIGAGIIALILVIINYDMLLNGKLDEDDNKKAYHSNEYEFITNMNPGTQFELDIKGAPTTYFQVDIGKVYFKWDKMESPVRISKEEYEKARKEFG